MYKLIYAGEVLEGQHPAVVRKRLATLLKLDDARMDVLFSGKPVVVKKSADDALKARYLTAFEKAGAQLRVQAVTSTPEQNAPQENTQKSTPETPAGASSEPAAQASAPAADVPPGQPSAELSALPVGADILSDAERTEFVPAEIATDHIKLQGAVFAVEDEAQAVSGPNVDHLSLAEVGEPLGDLGSQSTYAQDVELDLDIQFDLAEVGADMGVADTSAPPPAPDTSHITLDPTP